MPGPLDHRARVGLGSFPYVALLFLLNLRSLLKLPICLPASIPVSSFLAVAWVAFCLLVEILEAVPAEGHRKW